MIKKLVAIAAMSLYSLNASAGYVKYELNGPNIEGYFVQNEDDHSIAGYSFTVHNDRYGFSLFPSGNYARLNWTAARYDNQGPSRFGVTSNMDEWINVNMWFDFSATDNPDVYNITSRFSAYEWYREDWWTPFPPLVLYPRGTATRTVLDPEQAEYYDYYLREIGEYPDGLRHIAPRLHLIPEPTSLALLGLGAAVLTGTLRRRKERV